MSYFIYLRKSRKDEELEKEYGDTLIRHRKVLLSLAKRMNLTVTEIFEEVVSGESLASRPEIQRMLSEIERGGCDGVLVMEVERLARGDTVDQGIISRTFSITGTKIITPAKTYDPENEFDQEYFEFGLFMSRREYKTLQRRQQAGRIASVKEGKFVCSTAPYGYKKVKIKDGKGYTLEPEAPACDVVKTIFDLYLNGRDGESFGSYRIANYLESMHYKTATGRQWSASSVRDILKNVTYAGYVVRGREKEEKYVVDGVVHKRRVRSKDYLVAEGLHVPLVSKEDYERVQEKMKNNIHHSVNKDKKLKNPLAGLVYCAKCGRLMTRLGVHSHNRYATLICPNRDCDNISSPISLVEDEIVSFLGDWIHEQNIVTQTTKTISESADSVLKEISGTEKELASLRAQLEKTYTFLEKGLYSEEVFLDRNKKLTEDIASTEASLSALNKEYEEKLGEIEKINHMIPYAADLLESYDTSSCAAERNSILKELVDRVLYLKDAPNKKGNALEKRFTLEIHPKIR